MNTFGVLLKLTSYGESHGDTVGAVLDGFPANFEIDLIDIQEQLNRRRPGQSALSTSRSETDEVHINSGVFEGKTTGAPIHFFFKNKDAKSSDYDALKDVYRPSHADYTYSNKYGIRDYRGGGRSSARITAPWVAAGALAQQYILKKHNIHICATVRSIGTVYSSKEYAFSSRDVVDQSHVRCTDSNASQLMINAIHDAKEAKDSLGGQIDCVIKGVPAGLGEPVFDKLSAKLGQAMLSINAVKGFEYGGGFEMSKKRGSEVNDEFVVEGQTLSTSSNFSGGIQGGISNGMDITFRLAFKPTATIGKQQNTVDSNNEAVKLEAAGRHDPCVVPRAVPIVETLAALVLLDAILIKH